MVSWKKIVVERVYFSIREHGIYINIFLEKNSCTMYIHDQISVYEMYLIYKAIYRCNNNINYYSRSIIKLTSK